ncbi:thiamine pyrophosphate-dependent enzyme [Actinokineospora auranticolor]|uniref:Phosphonopyruvate decarboxylase n=1 Tax=Actinokineospora auranticolor TaxID=155976 RepID=A0A2S6GPL9_9PSEU|nr:thiamine pyrophosphate-dependent enzyme [Actinokineospora auranticolor]PPK67174.1 phosphonopyruvate decarboxylase [Actinokineospora auranticolor]
MAGVVSAAEFTAALRSWGVRRVTGVPCGHLAGPWALFDRAGELVPAVSEGAAVAIAAGWELGGTRAAVLCQNSGFGNLVNPLTSLLVPYHVPVLVVMTLRGWPDPARDEPQHAVMGASTEALLGELGVPHAVLGDGNLADCLARAGEARERGTPFFLLVPRGAIGGPDPVVVPPVADACTRADVVSALLDRLTDHLLVTTTGYLSRQAHHERDRPETLYMQGSMGHAAAIGLGLASALPSRRVVVLDGDGAFLMHLGTGATAAAVGGENLVHVVVDNGCYESTGCQPSAAPGVDWAAIGAGLGYRRVLHCADRTRLPAALDAALTGPGPVLCALQVTATPDEVHPRASADTGLDTIAERFRRAAAGRVTT